MAATSPATVTDVASRSLRALTTVETTWAGVALEDAFAQIVQQVPDVDTRLTTEPVDLSFKRLVVQVQVAMVLRVLKNPDGVLEQSIDDYRRRLDAAVSSGALYLSAAERDLLLSAAGSPSQSAGFTIRPWAHVVAAVPDPWEPYI